MPQTRVGAWSWDLVSAEVTWSDELYGIVGESPPQFTPSYDSYFGLVDPEHRPRCEAMVQAVLADGRSCAFEHPITRADGAVRWLRTLCVLESDALGVAVRMHGTVEDVTDYVVASTGSRAATSEAEQPASDGSSGESTQPPFRDRVCAALDRAERNGWWTALVVVDVEDRGEGSEAAADTPMWSELVERVETAFRAADSVSCTGETVGPEDGRLMVVCQNVLPSAGDALARRVARLVDRSDRVGPGPGRSAGIGVAFSPPGECDAEALIGRAGFALRQAGQQGPGAYAVFASPQLDLVDQAQARELRRAFDAGELRLHYQPKVALDSGHIAGVEGLLRWEHPVRGLVPPLEFIPLAERTGLILPIGEWVVDEACRDAARWRQSYPDHPRIVVSVNVSARQLEGTTLYGAVTDALSTHEIEPDSLCLEITESLLMQDVDGAVLMLTQLAALGVGLSIDDFGTGFSSLARLKEFQVDELKIDKSFVDGLGRLEDDTAIVGAVIAMAHALQLRVVAEGVETDEQRRRLLALGCDQAQGYLFARPGPAPTIDALLTTEADASWSGHGEEQRSTEPGAAAYRAERVLVVDDAEDVRKLALVTLSAVGFEVHEATDGSSALAAAKAVRPDCVVLDLVMPDMSGLEVCRALRTDPEMTDCTILVLTSVTHASGKVEAFSSGADDYIVKPFSPRDLAGRVSAAMRRRRQESLPDTEGLSAAVASRRS